MDSVVGDDPTLPVDFEASANLSDLPNVSTDPDITAANFDGTLPGIQKVSGGSGQMSPIRAHTMKDYEQQISELKKENFNLKLRIYFMEERLQPNFEENDDIKTNIELKVEVESLKKDLVDKQQLLLKASNAVESLVQEKEAIREKLKEENRKALEQLRQRLQAEAETSKKEVRDLNEALKQVQKQLDDAKQQECDTDPLTDRINHLEDALEGKNTEIAELKEKQDTFKLTEDELENVKQKLDIVYRENEGLKADLAKGKDQVAVPDPLQEMDLEQETRLKDLERASQNKDQQLEEKDKIIKDLNENLASKEAAIRSQESNSLKRDKAIQGLTELIRSKDKEIKQLCDQVDDQETALSNAREAVHKAEKNKYEGLEQYQSSMSDMETKLDETKSSLHRKHLENERLQRAVARKTQELDKLRENKATTEAQLDEILEQKDCAIKELKEELTKAKAQSDSRVGAIEIHYQGLLEDCQQQLQNKEQSIQRLTKGLEEKDKHVQEYMELTRNIHRPMHEEKDGKELLIQSLRERLKQRDKAVEDAIEEKFQTAELKDGEIRKLRVALRESDRELEKANGDLLAAQDKINQLEDSVEDKDAKNRQMRDSYKAQAKANKDAEVGYQQAMKDKDAVISKLKKALADKDGAIQELSHAKVKEGDELIEQLNDRIKQKEKLMQEILAERDQLAFANEKETHDLLGTLREKDNQIKDLHDRYNRMMASKNEMLKELQKELNEKEYEIQSAEDTLAQAEQEQAAHLNKMRNSLAEKDKTIEKLLTSGQEKDRLFWEMQQASDQSPSQSPEAMNEEIMKLKSELVKAKRALKEKEALIDELSAIPQREKDEAESLKSELENKNKLLAKAKNTIDSLQRDQNSDKQFRIDMSKLRRQNIELQSELQAKQDHIDALIHAGKVKDNVIQELRLQDTSLPVRNSTVGGDSSNQQLQQALIDHLAELSRLSDALKAERQLYVNITQGSSPSNSTHQGHSSDPSQAFDIELSAVQALRKQLEEGIKRNKEIRNNLLKQKSAASSAESEGLLSKDPEDHFAEIKMLKDQLEESQRWNASLQMRLDEMKQRADGVGSDVEPVIHTLKSDEEEASVTSQQQDAQHLTDVSKSATELQKDVIHLQKQLQDEIRRRKSLEDKLERQEVESLRSIPGQEEEVPSKKTSISVQKQLEDLQAKLSQSECERTVLTQQLEAVMLNQTQPEPDGGPVVPILKQQLDQAKTLLMEKDRKLQEKEQQNQALRHHLGIGPSSPITPGRSMLAGLRQENARLQHELQSVKSHNQNLEHHIQGLQAQCARTKQVEEALQQQLEKMAQSTPDDDEQLCKLAKELEIAKAQIQKNDQENRELRQSLGIGPHTPVEDGRNVIDKLQLENANLRTRLEEALKELEDVQVQLDLATKELEERPHVQVVDSKVEISRLQKQLQNADKLNELLKRHIELNSCSDGNQSFNPELIVDMAKEIEHLQEQIDQSAGGKGDIVTKKDDVNCSGVSQETGSAKERSTISAYKKKLRNVEGELDDTKQKIRSLQRRLQATEGTVHRQADKIKYYRREMHNAGIAPPGTPKRVNSDSNLLQSSILNGRIRSVSNYSSVSLDSASSSTSLSPAPSEQGLAVTDQTFSEFGYTDDISELKEQISVLKNQLQRLRRAIRHLQRRLRATEGSRSPSPTRSISDSWYELTANQEAFEKMRLELDNLREQLQQTNAANLTLQERNTELHNQLSVWSFDNRQQLDKQSQTQMDLGSKSRDPNAVGNDQDEQWKKLNKELQQRKDLNKKLRDLLAENQKMAEETGKELERLAKEVQEKNVTISTLRKQLRQVLSNRSSRTTSTEQQLIEHSTRMQTIQTGNKTSDSQLPSNKDHPDSAHQPQKDCNYQLSSRTHYKSSSTQTDNLLNTTVNGDTSSNRTEVNNLKTKLRETERLSRTLKTELEIYRKVQDGWHSIPNDPNEVLQEHLEEIRTLRKRLEESINVNDRLREQLEAKLAGDSVTGTIDLHLYQTQIELNEENNSLKEQVTEKEQLIKELKEEVAQTRRNLHRFTSENQQLKEQLEENVHLADSLRFELSVYEHLQEKRSKDNCTGKENHTGISSPLHLTDPSSGIDLTELLREIRHLRIQLERSIDTNNALRLRLEEMMNEKQGSRTSSTTIKVTKRSVENQRDTTVKRSLFRDEDILHPRGRYSDNSASNSTNKSESQRSNNARMYHYTQDVGAETEEPEFYTIPSGTGSMSSNIPIPTPQTNGDVTSSNSQTLSKDGEELYAICTLVTYKLIKRSLHEGRVLGNLTETKLLELANSFATKGEQQSLSYKKCQDLSKNIKHLISHLEECSHLLELFWKSKLPQNDELVVKLKKRLSAQEKLMREALERLSATNRMKEGMEQAIIDQLAMTHTVLRQARGNLEAQPR